MLTGPQTGERADKDDIFYSVKPEDKEKDKNDKERRKQTTKIVDKERDRRQEEFEKAPLHNDGKRPSVFRPNARKKYDEEESRIRKDHDKKQAAYYNYLDTNDADIHSTVNRHIRRHPEQYKECGIFESCEFIY